MKALKIPTNRWTNMWQVQRQPLAFFSALAKEGKLVRYPMGIWTELFLVASPSLIKHVLVTNARNYSINLRHRRMFKLAMGEGLFTSEGDSWLFQRRLMQPTFHSKSVAELSKKMEVTIQRRLSEWTKKQTFDLSDEMTSLSLNIISECLFGLEMTSSNRELRNVMSEMMALFAAWIRSPLVLLPISVVLPRRRRLLSCIAQMDQQVNQIIKMRQQEEGEGDLLSLLLKSVDLETGRKLSTELLRDEVRTLLVAGHETTASLLTWAFYLISQHPECEQRLHSELDQVLSGKLPTAELVKELPYTRYVISETLRLYPPLWITFRKSRKEDELDGYPISAGARLTICPYVTHRDPEYWSNPEEFIPSRFSNPESYQLDAYLPFGAGPRQCIGKHFANQSAQLILASVAQRFKLRFPHNASVRKEALLTIRPQERLYAHLIPR